MRNFLNIFTDVIRLLTFQTKPERFWEEPPRRKERSLDKDVKPGSRHPRNGVE